MSKIQLPKNIGQGKPAKIKENVQYFDTSHHGSFFPFGVYFTTKFSKKIMLKLKLNIINHFICLVLLAIHHRIEQ
jgi:hypothetical protein